MEAEMLYMGDNHGEMGKQVVRAALPSPVAAGPADHPQRGRTDGGLCPGWDETPAAYAIYVLSFYTLSALTLFFCTAFLERFRQLQERVRAHPLGSRYMTDAAFKVRLSPYLSLGINLTYSVFKLVSGIRYRSLWIGAMAVYYILLSTIRFCCFTICSAGRTRESGGNTAATGRRRS